MPPTILQHIVTARRTAKAAARALERAQEYEKTGDHLAAHIAVGNAAQDLNLAAEVTATVRAMFVKQHSE